SAQLWPAMLDRHLTHRLMRVSDSVKTEFSIPVRNPLKALFRRIGTLDSDYDKDIKLALGCAMSRDAADGRPANVWIPGLLNEDAALYATAGILTHGCIANLDVYVERLPDPLFEPAFALGKKVSGYLGDAAPLRWAAVHYSEHGRDQYLSQPERAVKEAIAPFAGAYGALLRQRLPAGVVTDGQLEEGRLDGYRLLFLPTPDHLTEPMQRAVAAFEKAGGLVLAQRPAWNWWDPATLEDTRRRFLDAIDEGDARPPLRVTGGPPALHAVPYRTAAGDRLVVLLCNDFSWVWTGTKKNKARTPQAVLDNQDPPSPCRGVSVTISGAEKPQAALEAVSGKSLDVEADGSQWTVALPDFGYMAAVVFDLG
ncbi:MAG: hypothetical protein M3Z21_04995, partial [Pseudomonadota bacterium]|nr:hypothetical protein [Pseudomonadota bacterium]